MTSGTAEESGNEEERLKKFKKSQKVRSRYASAQKANAILQSQGYDHLESPDFFAGQDAVSKEYQKKAEEMRVRYVAHGIVQGVGYRNFVRLVAKRHGITGYVRNVSDGSVEMLAVGDRDSIAAFEKEIEVSDRYGAQTMHIDKEVEKEDELEYADFRIEKDKKL